ncbi:MAG: tetratricopeptide repeat protein [Thermoanaerobaculia bacterium]
MNRDNVLFLTIGALVGFITGYLLHEVMATRQPPRLTPELRAQIVAPGGEQGAPPDGGQDGQAPADGAAPPANGGTGPVVQEVQELRATLAKNPNDTVALRRLADLHSDISDWQQAIQLYSHYLEIKPDDPDVLTDLGICYRGTKQFDEALKRFRQAKKISPDHWKAYFDEVVVLVFDLKKYDEAEPVLAKLQQMQPNNPNVAQLAAAVAKQRTAA